MKAIKRLMILAGLGACLVACPKSEGGPKDPKETTFDAQPTVPATAK